MLDSKTKDINSWLAFLGHAMFRLTFAGIFCWIWLFAWNEIQNRQIKVSVAAIEIAIPTGQSRILGSKELSSVLSEVSHIRVNRDQKGAWTLQNVSRSREVEVHLNDHDHLLRTLKLEVGNTISIMARKWKITRADSELDVYGDTDFVTKFGMKGFWYNGVEAGFIDQNNLRRDSAVCLGGSFVEKALQAWNRNLPTLLGVSRPLELGGNVFCNLKVGHENVDTGSILIKKNSEGDFLLRADPITARSICLIEALPAKNSGCAVDSYLFEQSVPLDGISTFVVGRSKFSVYADGNVLKLKPLGRVFQYSPEEAAERQAQLEKEGVKWTLVTTHYWKFIGHLHEHAWSSLTLSLFGLVVFAVLVTLVEIIVRQVGIGRRADLIFKSYVLLIVVNLMLLILGACLYILGGSIGICWGMLTLLFAFFVLNLVSPWNGFTYCTVIGSSCALVVVGIAVQLVLGFQAADTGNLRFVQKMIATGVMSFSVWSGCSLLVCLRQKMNTGTTPWQIKNSPKEVLLTTREMVLWILSIVAIILLYLQVVFGAEEGLWGLQPVELAKLMMIVSTALILTLRMEAQPRRTLLRKIFGIIQLMTPITLSTGLVIVALLVLKDISPIVILGSFIAGIAIAWVLAKKNPFGFMMICILFGLLAWFVSWIQQDEGLKWIVDLKLNLYADRFLAWAEPLLHPHNGQQYLRASEALQQGGLLGSDVVGWTIPAVQFDFTPAFFIGKFGVLSALIVLSIQVIWLLSILCFGWINLTRSRNGNYRARWGGAMTYFMCFGFAFLFIGHCLISWSTNFGWIPVVGQQMPLLAAGTSILVLLITPFIAIVSCTRIQST